MSIHDMITTSVNVKIFDTPDEAPKYGEDTKLLRATEAVVVGKGTVAGLPTMDLQLVDADGNKYLVMATGAIIEALARVCAGKRETDEPGEVKNVH